MTAKRLLECLTKESTGKRLCSTIEYLVKNKILIEAERKCVLSAHFKKKFTPEYGMYVY